MELRQQPRRNIQPLFFPETDCAGVEGDGCALYAADDGHVFGGLVGGDHILETLDGIDCFEAEVDDVCVEGFAGAPEGCVFKCRDCFVLACVGFCRDFYLGVEWVDVVKAGFQGVFVQVE